MKYLIIFLLSGCASTEVQNPLYVINKGGVNTGQIVPVTEMRVIRGELWIY